MNGTEEIKVRFSEHGAFRASSHAPIIYVIAADPDGPVKIGVTKNVWRRVSTLQVGCWLRLKAYAFRMAFRRGDFAVGVAFRDSLDEGAGAVERECHKKLKEIGLHLCGEWFDISVPEAIAVVEKCGPMVGAKVFSIEQIAGENTDAGIDAGVEKSQTRLVKEMLRISRMMQIAADENDTC